MSRTVGELSQDSAAAVLPEHSGARGVGDWRTAVSESGNEIAEMRADDRPDDTAGLVSGSCEAVQSNEARGLPKSFNWQAIGTKYNQTTGERAQAYRGWDQLMLPAKGRCSTL